MNITIISHGYPSKNDPQWGCFERDQALALQQLGHHVTLIYVDGRFRKIWKKPGVESLSDGEISIYGIYLFPLNLLKGFPVKFRFWVSEKLMERVFHYMLSKHGMPDILYAHYLFNIARIVSVKRKYNIPLVGIEHWSILTQDTIPPYYDYMGKIAYENLDCSLAVSKFLAFHVNRHYNICPKVIYNMLGPEFLAPQIKKANNKKYFFIGIGSLINAKRFDVAIKAFAYSGLKEKNCSMVIVGDGPEKENLQQLIKKMKLDNHVNLVGRKNKSEVVGCLSDSKVLILSSKSETFSVVCIEALSQGLPVISTKCGGPEELINEDNGILVAPDNIEAMSLAMRTMFDTYSNYNLELISKVCLQKFSPHVIAKQLTQIFEDVVRTNE